MRIGKGFDVHRFAEGRDLVLGGVKIPYELGLLGHSDADVLLHAICDALLGAAALGDIGVHFPDTDPRFKGVSSILLLEETGRLIREKGYDVGNIDCTVFAEVPKVMPHAREMVSRIAGALEIDKDRINIKATTFEGLGAVGRKEGIAAESIALLVSGR